uniref:Uncharacterized protein n=1 Tax=Arundo donax TaxID=35708 RepID=A0A0A9CKY7_ARUDO
MAASWWPRMCSGASTLTLLFSTTNRPLTATIKNDTATTPASHRTRSPIAADQPLPPPLPGNEEKKKKKTKTT